MSFSFSLAHIFWHPVPRSARRNQTAPLSLRLLLLLLSFSLDHDGSVRSDNETKNQHPAIDGKGNFIHGLPAPCLRRRRPQAEVRKRNQNE
jgi:hypothetical protein